MKTVDLASWLKDRAKGADPSWARVMNWAAERLLALESELQDERYRHDRLQDFEVAEAQMLPRWIPVDEKLPKTYEAVLVCRKVKGAWRVEQGCRELNGWWKVYGSRTKTITHWMPLPEPPKEAGYGEKE